MELPLNPSLSKYTTMVGLTVSMQNLNQKAPMQNLNQKAPSKVSQQIQNI